MSTSPQIAELAAPIDALPAWKQEVNARLSAHRNRRGAFAQQPALPGMEPEAPAGRARVAARVAERYAKAPSYSEVLAAEAAKAARAAEAAAQAAREAQEAAQAVTDVLWAGLDAELQHDPDPDPVVSLPQPQQYRVDPASLPAARHQGPSPSLPQLHQTPAHAVDPHPHVDDPLEEDMVAPAQPLPARVLEFPRELVAARKARPRIAEGPLREGAEEAQLRIFEVETDDISHLPAPAPEEFLVPEWSSIRLDATPRAPEQEMSTASTRPRPASRSAAPDHAAPISSRARRPDARNKPLLADMLLLHVAPVGDRLMAALVDMALVLFAFMLFVLVFVACTPRLPMGKPTLIAAAAALAGFTLLYQWLFFTFAETTPGMRYARIALCTFDDENPDRKSLQRRVGACCLAALPLGLGLLWALLDDDRLGWHDRMTRTYQRSYR